jgi:hypothetical protein
LKTTEPETLKSPDDPRLQQYLEEIQAIRLEARALGELTPEQFNWRPNAKRWSVGQCLEHIILTGRIYPRKIEKMLAESQARQARGERPYVEGVITRWFVRAMEPPPVMRIRTVGEVDPPRRLDRDVVMANFEAVHDEIERLIRQADGSSLVHARGPSAFVSVLRFTVGQTMALSLGHARRHLWQARQVTSAPGFPGR